MSRAIATVRLTDAQRSAVECSGVLDDPADGLTDEEQVLRLALTASGRLVVSVTTQWALVAALTGLANAEDADAERLRRNKAEGAAAARRACVSLTALATAVGRLELKTAEGNVESGD